MRRMTAVRRVGRPPAMCETRFRRGKGGARPGRLTGIPWGGGARQKGRHGRGTDRRRGASDTTAASAALFGRVGMRGEWQGQRTRRFGRPPPLRRGRHRSPHSSGAGGVGDMKHRGRKRGERWGWCEARECLGWGRSVAVGRGCTAPYPCHFSSVPSGVVVLAFDRCCLHHAFRCRTPMTTRKGRRRCPIAAGGGAWRTTTTTTTTALLLVFAIH